MEEQTHLWFLMSLCLSGEASVEEETEFRELLAHDQQLQQQYALMQAYWATGRSSVHPTENGRLLSSIFEKAEATKEISPQPSRKRIPYVAWAVAAAVILILLMPLIFAKKQEVSRQATANTEKKQIVTPAGSRMKTLLPDGSTVWLNANSRLLYNNDFRGNTREVTLEGEGFFDVVKMATKPFIVHAGRINIKVLGTAFNVRSYASDKNIETTLLRGKIEVTQPLLPSLARIILHPHEKLILPTRLSVPAPTPTGDAIKSAPAKVDHLDEQLKSDQLTETAWIYNRLEFRDEDFVTIAHKMERWYNVKFNFYDEAVEKRAFNGSFEKESLPEALEALQKASHSFQFKIINNEVFIKSSR